MRCGMRSAGIRITILCCSFVLPARADQPVLLRLKASAESCPTPDQLSAALVAVRPPIVVTEGASAELRVVDHGSSYQLSIGTTRRTFSDPERRCEERARATAVFATLAVAQNVSPPIPLDPPHEKLRESSSVGPPWFTVEAAGVFALAPKAVGIVEAVPSSVGVAFRVAALAPHLGVALGVTWLDEIGLSFSEGQVRLRRLPIDFDLRARWQWSRMEVFTDLALLVIPLSVRGVGFSIDRQASSVDLGARWGLGLRYRTAHLAPFFQVELALSPSHGLQVDRASSTGEQLGPGVPIGQTPGMWLAAALGIELKIF